MSRIAIGVASIAVELPHPGDRGEDRERRLAGGRLHRVGGEQPGREEREVRHAAERRAAA